MLQDDGHAAPYFSVIISSYDRQSLLEVAIGSVQAQEFTDWELIVVDDCSPAAVVVPNDPRILRVRNETNLGKANSVNRALRMARGRFVAFLDDDDTWGSMRLQHARVAHDSGADVAMCGSRTLDEGSKGIEEVRSANIEVVPDRETQRWESLGHMGALTVRREVCLEFDPSYRACEDVEWGIRMLLQGLSVFYIFSFDFNWRRHGGPRHMNGIDKRIEGSLKLLEAHSEFYGQRRRQKAVRVSRLGDLYWRSSLYESALTSGARSCLIHPHLHCMRLVVSSVVAMLGSQLRPEGGSS